MRQQKLTSGPASTYIDAMGDEIALAEAASGSDPATGLRAARALRDLAERLEALQVGNARAHGWSWQEIAVFLGVSKQAVHKKHAGRRSVVTRD
jgi:DNA-directed RNA polymerase specialized sigma24 family protein